MVKWNCSRFPNAIRTKTERPADAKSGITDGKNRRIVGDLGNRIGEAVEILSVPEGFKAKEW